ncbi:hypothetical protein HDV04_004610 [Boothiomyces sp. JEL0838]|nr:hypothetical protein HDV04_004610 [Boothiomyces sp. JEL0838]
MATFLSDFCDFNISIAGCKNADSFRLVTVVSAAFQILALIFIMIHPIFKVIRKLKSPNAEPPVMKDLLVITSILGVICHSFGLAKYIILTVPYSNSGPDTLVYYAKVAIALEFCGNSIGGMAMTFLTSHFVRGAIGTHTDLFLVNGAKINPQVLLKYFRLTVFIYTLVTHTLWICYGLQDQQSFILYRRMIYYAYTIITGIISPCIYYGFLTAIINKLKSYYSDNGEVIPVSLQMLIMLRNTLSTSYSFASSLTMFFKVVANEYLQTYLLAFQIVTNILLFYTATVISSYGLYKTFPKLLERIQTKRASKKSKLASMSRLMSRGDKSSVQAGKASVPATVLLQNTVIAKNFT